MNNQNVIVKLQHGVLGDVDERGNDQTLWVYVVPILLANVT